MELQLKQKLYELCIEHIDENIDLEKKAMAEVEEAAELEAKSSVGDKYETGRSMMHIEIDKHKAQVAQYLQQRSIMDQIDVSKVSDEIKPGAVVITNQSNFFIAVGIGDLEYDGKSYCTMSLGSPLGKAISHKKIGEELTFRDKTFTIDDVV